MFDNVTANLPTKLTTKLICPLFSEILPVVSAGSQSLKERHNRLFSSAIGWSLLFSRSLTLYPSTIPISVDLTQSKQFESYPDNCLTTQYQFNVDSYLFAVISQCHQKLTQYLYLKRFQFSCKYYIIKNTQ